MDRYKYQRPKGYRYIKLKDGKKYLSLPDMNPRCMCCAEHNGNDYYEAINMKTGEYGYLCNSCVTKMEATKKCKQKR